MKSTILISVLIVGVTMAATQDPITVNMDNADHCGKKQDPMFTQKVNLFSMGKAPDGYCNLPIHGSENKPAGCKYSALCVSVKSSSMNDCSAKVTFTGRMGDGTSDQTRQLSCFIPNFGSDWCVPTDLLVVELSESTAVADNTKSRNYAFNATVYSKCSEKPLPREPLLPDDEYVNPNQEEADHYNRILGVIVGVCLCSMFLVILLITYCFYKNKAYSEPPSQSKENLVTVVDDGLAAKHKPRPIPAVTATKITITKM